MQFNLMLQKKSIICKIVNKMFSELKTKIIISYVGRSYLEEENNLIFPQKFMILTIFEKNNPKTWGKESLKQL